jgi:mannose/cellobiose epimerase-like protein (N-acyl-D-glucosamine 2-epimerase family)
LTNLDNYRGQNANMHMCEALIAAWQATKEQRYLERAKVLANRFAFELAEQSNGLIWEHYDANWHVDMQYNIDKPDDLFKPWGFQPGHQVEWTKLLLQLNDAAPEDRYVTKAAFLFDEAWRYGWDTEFGGLVYGFAPDKTFSDAHKYFWVHAEAFAAAWRLYKVTGKPHYLDCYNDAWQWSWNYLIDHQYGAWYRIRNRDGSAFDDLKSPPGKTDYHTLGAVWDVLDNH